VGGRGGTREGWGAGPNGRASGGGGTVAGAVGRVGSGGVRRCGGVEHGGHGSAGDGDGVDAVDSRGDVESRVLAARSWRIGGKGAHKEGEEDRNDLLEGAHLDGSGSGIGGVVLCWVCVAG